VRPAWGSRLKSGCEESASRSVGLQADVGVDT
jgi:hypothetical protein